MKKREEFHHSSEELHAINNLWYFVTILNLLLPVVGHEAAKKFLKDDMVFL